MQPSLTSPPAYAPTGGPTTTRRASATRAALLAAAREVFTVAGYTDANIAEVVTRAGASVGSLYHHFGGKADLYLALFEDYQRRQEDRAASGVRGARSGGEVDPIALFCAGARGYLQGCWAERDLARLFLAGGGPPGFELVARRRYREWTGRNAYLLRPHHQPLGDTLVLVLTTVVGEAGHEIAIQESPQAAQRLADEVLELIMRIGGPR